MTFLNHQLSAVFEDDVVDGSWNWIIDNQGYADIYDWMLEAIAPCVLVTLGAGRPIPHNNLARLRLLDWDWMAYSANWKNHIFFTCKIDSVSVIQCHKLCVNKTATTTTLFMQLWRKIWKPTFTFVGCDRTVDDLSITQSFHKDSSHSLRESRACSQYIRSCLM
jgi:hypothetical protein